MDVHQSIDHDTIDFTEFDLNFSFDDLFTDDDVFVNDNIALADPNEDVHFDFQRVVPTNEPLEKFMDQSFGTNSVNSVEYLSIDIVNHLSEAPSTQSSGNSHSVYELDIKNEVDGKKRKHEMKRKQESDQDGNDEKRTARLMRNRESAQLSRQRKKQYVEELEDKVRAMHATIIDLNAKMSFFMAENATLRHQMGGGGVMCPPVHGLYSSFPMAPMGYPWIPCQPFAMNGSRTHVMQVPIPRLKPQQLECSPKSKRSSKKSGSDITTKNHQVSS